MNKKDFPVEHLWISNKELQLVFDVEFPEKNSLELFSFTDLAGNVSSYQCIDFVYYVARKFDIVISEIMADPTPSAGLPECEYLELANQCGQDIEIRNWSLLIGGDTIKFPGYTIHSGEYLLLCGADHVDGFSDSVHILGLSGFPALSNEGALIQLYNDKMELIHAVHFSREWYSSTAKQEGGWSLEIKDISHACIIDDNWSESISNRGGTPGKANSVAGSVADTAAPFVKQVFLNEEMQLEIVFSESMDRASLVDIENYSDEIIQFFDPPCVSKPFAEKVVLTFKNQLNDYQKHVLKLSSMLTDCSGNSIKDKFVFYGLPQEADSSDIIINEVMFESTEDIPEFIEIYNNSQKIIDLRNFQLGYFDSFTETFTRQILFTRDNFYIYPGDYLTITPDKGQLCNYYQINDQRKVIGAGKWINLVNDGGKIAVISSTGKIIDQSSYNKEMHFGLLVETSGVSLEKIACNVSGTDGDNWHSASSLSNYASPCRQNSQHYFSNSGGSSFVLEPEGISPDNDGYRDFLSISYRFNKPGYLISIAVYNTKGEEVAIIANNELSGTEGIYYWKGLDANNDKLPMGYYIVFCEAIHPEGEKKQKKGSVLVLPQKK